MQKRGTPLRIGTRGSDLALWQARQVLAGLDGEGEIVVISTRGDRDRVRALQGRSETGFFTREIEKKLLGGEIDLAVHSLKDLPTTVDSRLSVAAVLERWEVGDMLLVHPDWYSDEGILPLRFGCVVGAGSLRRQAMLRVYAPGVVPSLIRGNVPTRVRKCLEGQYGAVVVARAGVERLGLDVSPLLAFDLHPNIWLCAPGQGAIAVEVRAGDERALAAAAKLNHVPTMKAVTLERRLLSNFKGGCHTAFAAHALPVNDGAQDLWSVAVGMDRGGSLGWGQGVYVGSMDTLSRLGPERLADFSPVKVTCREELCTPRNARRIDLPFQPARG